jgi:acetoin utilization protein AcuB
MASPMQCRGSKEAEMRQPTVASYMTAAPFSIGVEQTLDAAHRMMREHGIRHLPVLDRGTVVGVVSTGDLHLLETLRDVDPKTVTVEDAMTPEPYVIGPRTSLAKVVETMAQHKYGTALVVEHERLVGVFSTVDALRALADLLRSDATTEP